MNRLFQIILITGASAFIMACGQTTKSAMDTNALASDSTGIAGRTMDNAGINQGQIQIGENGNAGPEINAQSQKQNTGNSPFFPLAIGNYWIYSVAGDPGITDTLLVTGTRTINGQTVYVFNTGLLLYQNNDTLYSMQPQRGGHFTSSVEYFPSENKKEFQVLIGGDVTSSKTVSKIEKPYAVLNTQFTGCYRFEQRGSNGVEYEIISRGVGFIERKIAGPHLLLKEYYFKK